MAEDVDTPSIEYKIFTSLRWDPTRSAHTALFKKSELDQGKSYQTHPNDLLTYHFDRLVESAKGCGFTKTYNLLNGNDDGHQGLDHLKEAIDSFFRPTLSNDKSICKVRLSFNKYGVATIDKTTLFETSDTLWPFIPSGLKPDELFVVPNNTKTTEILPLEARWNNKSSPFFSCHMTKTWGTVYLDPHSIPPSIFTTHKTTHRPMYDAARKATNINDKSPTEAEVLLQNTNGEIMEASISTPYFYRNGWITPPLSSGGNAGVTRRLALELDCCVEQVIKASDLQNGEMIWMSNGVRGFWQATLKLNEVEPAAESTAA
jgi:4-amino-4-deoxychorismate lyase